MSSSSRPKASIPALVLTILAVGYTLALARAFLLPIAFAWLAKSALVPLIRWGGRLGIAAPLAAAAIVGALTLAVGAGVYQLSGPATAWAERLPEDLQAIRDRLQADRGGAQSPIESVAKATEAVAGLAESESPGEKPLEVAVVPNRPTADLLGGVWDFGANFTITLILLYFMLATGDRFMAKVVAIMPRLSDAKAAVATARAVESGIASYLTTVVAINVVLGVLVGVACWSFGLPNPILWGALAGVFNFVPYVGAMTGIAVVAIVGLTTLPDLVSGLMPAAIYAVLTGVEGLIVTPIIVGRRLTLSPVFLFIWLLLMSWLWGIPGALLAVPLLAAGKITCDHVPRLQAVGRFLGA